MAETPEGRAETRFWSKVTKTDTCWPWAAGIHRSGYGLFSVGHKQIYAHRFSYQLHKGPIPEGLILDHTCHGADAACPSGNGCLHRRCVNPDHLEAVLPVQNVYRGNTLAAENAAKTQCPAGHPYDNDNTYVTPQGWRVCRRCVAQREAKRRVA